MARILADLPDEDIRRLDRIADARKTSRAAVLRDAVKKYQAHEPMMDMEALQKGFGLWMRHGVLFDVHDYARKRRAEWTRPWDDDYDEVRAESPDCFTEEDDRERAHYVALGRREAARRRNGGE